MRDGMGTLLFAPRRADGRSDRQVIYDLVQGAEPDTVFRYDALESALREGTDGDGITRQAVYAAVTAANRTLLREKRRALRGVPRLGYRVARADEHVELALMRKDRAQIQIKRGLDGVQRVSVVLVGIGGCRLPR